MTHDDIQHIVGTIVPPPQIMLHRQPSPLPSRFLKLNLSVTWLAAVILTIHIITSTVNVIDTIEAFTFTFTVTVPNRRLPPPSTGSRTFFTTAAIPTVRSQNRIDHPNRRRRRCRASLFGTPPESSSSSSSSSRPSVLIVGGGVGGLATASRLASSLPPSTRVRILEKNRPASVGGRCGSFYREVEGLGRFRHERGPSLLLLREEYLALFSDCRGGGGGGGTAEEYGLEMVQCVPGYRVVFDDGDTIDLGFPKGGGVDGEAESRGKMDGFEEDGKEKWDEYMRVCSAFLDCGLPNFIEERLDLESFPRFLIEASRDWFKCWPLKPHSDVLDALFTSNKMRALASFQDLYVGLEPYRDSTKPGGGVLGKTAPAVFGLLAALELHPTNDKAGVFAPIGGFQAVSQSFEKLALACGVEIEYGKTVTEVTKDGVWVLDDDDDTTSSPYFINSECTVINADLPFATKSLLGEDLGGSASKHAARYDWDDTLDYSSGVVAFHWSVSKTCDELNTHNVFLAANTRSDMEDSWTAVRSSEPTADRRSFDGTGRGFNFYVHRPTATDPTAAPPGCDTLMVLVPCPPLRRDGALAERSREECVEGYVGAFGEEYVEEVRKAVLGRLAVVEGLEGLWERVVDEVVDTPGTYADFYNVAAGVPFALSHGFGQLSLTRPGQQLDNSDNIFFVGASTRPGNGVPLVLIGAKQVAQKVLRKFSITNTNNRG